MPDVSPADLLALGSATLGESGAHAMRARVKPVWPGACVAGPAFTVRCTSGDNLGIHVGVAHAPAASVLVVDVGIEAEMGYWGEVLTTAAQARGVAGLVIDGGVRDVDALAAHEFPVFSTMIALKGATKRLPGAVGEAVECGDVTVHAGDWIVGDADGVVVIPHAHLDEVVAAGQARADKEQQMFAGLEAGRATIELLGLDPSPIRGASQRSP